MPLAWWDKLQDRPSLACALNPTHTAWDLRTQHLSLPHPYKTGKDSTLKLHEQLSTKMCFWQLASDIKKKRTQIFRALASGEGEEGEEQKAKKYPQHKENFQPFL